jgi:lipopolysaccharide cholinephosphotransferase
MEKLDIKQVQKMQLDVLDMVHGICLKHSIKYYLIGGALIGAIRHKGFIPWDDDIDIGMMRSDYNRFLEICKEELGESYFLQVYGSDKGYYLPIARICIRGTYIDEYYSAHLKFNKGLYFDIFPLDNIPDDENKRAKQESRLLVIDTLLFFKNCLVYHIGPFRIKLILKKLIGYGQREHMILISLVWARTWMMAV